MVLISIFQGVLNVVMGKAPDIGDALLASHEVLHPSSISLNQPSLLFDNMALSWPE
jgi:hypothetical protein